MASPGLILIAAAIITVAAAFPIHPDHGRDFRWQAPNNPRIDSNSRGYLYSGRGLPIHPDHGRDLDGKPRIDSNSRGFIRIMAVA